MQILSAIVLTVLPGSWVTYGLCLSGIPSRARLALGIALSPAVIGLQLVALEAVGLSFSVAAYALVVVNLPCVVLLARRHRLGRIADIHKDWLASATLLVMLVAIPVLIWSLIPGIRRHTWSAMLQTDVVYAVTRTGARVEEANLAGLSLAYGWCGHSLWSVIGWIGNWPPTAIYPFTNVLWILVTLVVSYELGRTGLGLQSSTALLGVGMLFLSTNVVGMIVLVVAGPSEWWERYLGDFRYSPFLSKYYAFDTMLWGMALLVAIALVYTLALRTRVVPLDALTVALLVGLGLVYPVLFPAGLAIAGCFIFLAITRWPEHLPIYTRGEMGRLALAVLLSAVVILIYLGVTTADREAGPFAISALKDIRTKFIRLLGALGPLGLLALAPVIIGIRLRDGPTLLLALAAVALSACYVVVDLAQLEYKYVLAATICLALLAVSAVDAAFRRQPRRGLTIATTVSAGLAAISLLVVFQAGGHIPGNLDRAPRLDESSFWIALSPSEQDAIWTRAIRENTAENTVVVARRPGVQLSAIVGRSMYVPSDIGGGQVPGYNLDQRFHLLRQRGYSAAIYDRRLAVVDALYASRDEVKVVEAFGDLKALERPAAIHYADRDTYSLRWLESRHIGRQLISDGHNVVWLVDDPAILP